MIHHELDDRDTFVHKSNFYLMEQRRSIFWKWSLKIKLDILIFVSTLSFSLLWDLWLLYIFKIINLYLKLFKIIKMGINKYMKNIK